MTFATRVLQELGSVTNLDRLVVFPQRPNIDKGAIFGGTPPYTALNFGRRSPQAQLLTMKELGMAFTYMNIPAVVNAFCATYEGIYTLMGEFDTW
jgi:chitinase